MWLLGSSVICSKPLAAMQLAVGGFLYDSGRVGVLAMTWVPVIILSCGSGCVEGGGAVDTHAACDAMKPPGASAR